MKVRIFLVDMICNSHVSTCRHGDERLKLIRKLLKVTK